MDKNTFKNSSKFNDIFMELINFRHPSMGRLQKRWGLSFQQVEVLFEELQLYHSDVFLMSALAELTKEEEPPTIARIMNKFNVSYYLAKKIFESYMEDC